MFSGIVPVVKAYIVDAFDAEEVPKVLAYSGSATQVVSQVQMPGCTGGRGLLRLGEAAGTMAPLGLAIWTSAE